VPTSALVHPRTTAFRLADLPENAIRRVDLVDTESLTEELRRYDDVVVVNAVGRSGHPDTPGGPDRVSLWRDTVLTTVSLLDALPTDRLRGVVHLAAS
jgi:hypothetical protein